MDTTKTTRAQKAYEKAQRKFTDHILNLIYSIDDMADALETASRGLDNAEYFSKAPYLDWDKVVRELQETYGKLIGAKNILSLGDFGDKVRREVAELNAKANALRNLADKVGGEK